MCLCWRFVEPVLQELGLILLPVDDDDDCGIASTRQSSRTSGNISWLQNEPLPRGRGGGGKGSGAGAPSKWFGFHVAHV